MKPDFDWGGYQGIVEWSNRNPGKVRLHANDMRDWGTFRIGDKPVLNIVKPKTIGIPQIIKEIEKPKEKVASKPPKRKYDHVDKPKELRDPRPKRVAEVQRQMKSQYAGTRWGSKLPKGFMKKFLVSRLGAAGPYQKDKKRFQ